MSRPWGKGFYNLIFNPSFIFIDFAISGSELDLIPAELVELPIFVDIFPATGL